MKSKINILIIFIGLLLIGCSTTKQLPYELIDFKYYETPIDLASDSSRAKTINYYKKSLGGRKIFLDPGHGGDDKKNSSMSGKVIEAEVNLRVAHFLKKFLIQAGAKVILSRNNDETLDLAERSRLANISDAEIFVSIHHNAAGEGNYWANYTSTYFHARVNDYEYEPFNNRLAKYVQRDLAYVMRNSGGLGSFDGTYSDYKIYPKSGFSVLRKTEIPAILIECSFHTNRFEESRLNDEEFNRIQAWGIFRGIGKFFSQSFPNVNFLYDESSYNFKQLNLLFELESQKGIDSGSVKTYFDSTEVKSTFNIKYNILNVNLTNIEKGLHELKIVAANKKGNYSFPFKIKILTR